MAAALRTPFRKYIESHVIRHKSQINSIKRNKAFSTSTSASEVTAMSGMKRAVGGVIFGSLVLGTAGLGTWQVQRYNWKVGKIDHRKEELRLPPLPIDEIVTVLKENNCEKDACARTTSIQGHFDHKRSILVGRRGAPDGLVGEKPQGMATAPSGYFLCTVFRLEDGREILVNRGWMPAQAAQDGLWDRPEGMVTLNGMVSFGETKSLFSPTNDPNSGTMLWLELASIQKHFNIDGNWCGLPKPIMMELLTLTHHIENNDTKSLKSLSSPSQQPKRNNGLLWFVPDPLAFWRGGSDDGENTRAPELKKKSTNEEKVVESSPSPWPMCKSLKNYESFSVMPETHAVYAATWISLSLFGLAASMRLLRRPVKSMRVNSTQVKGLIKEEPRK